MIHALHDEMAQVRGVCGHEVQLHRSAEPVPGEVFVGALRAVLRREGEDGGDVGFLQPTRLGEEFDTWRTHTYAGLASWGGGEGSGVAAARTEQSAVANPPFRFHGRWLAVHMSAPSYIYPFSMVLMKHAGVVASPMSTVSTPREASPPKI